MNKLYVTEPDTINLQIVKELLDDNWTVIEGNTSFSGQDVEECLVLIIRSKTTITASIRDVFPKLESIIRIGVGVDTIDMDYCTDHGIAVYNSPGANADAVSDYVIGMMFEGLRKTYLLTRQDIKSWNRFKFTGRSMADRTIGIVGFGNIGKQIFSKLQGFNCKAFIVYDPFVKKEQLPEGTTYAATVEEALCNSDIVTLHVPLTSSTKYLIDNRNLTLMSSGSILINASRGGIVNEADILHHMQSHDLIYIADTVENEPAVSDALLDATNVIVTPHIASLTKESDDNMVTVALTNFLGKEIVNRQ